MRGLLSKVRSSSPEDGAAPGCVNITDRIHALALTPAGQLAELSATLDGMGSSQWMLMRAMESEQEVSEKSNIVQCVFPAGASPRFEDLWTLCGKMEQWLRASPNHTVYIQGELGSGHVGVVASSLLLYSGLMSSAMEAVAYFARKPLLNPFGVASPSQLRYVGYCEEAIRDGCMEAAPLIMERLSMFTIPEMDSKGGCVPFVEVRCEGELVFSSRSDDKEKMVRYVAPTKIVDIDLQATVQGNVTVSVLHLNLGGFFSGVKSICSFQFNTSFVGDGTLQLDKNHLDGARQDKRVASNFYVETVTSRSTSEKMPLSRLHDEYHGQTCFIADRPCVADLQHDNLDAVVKNRALATASLCFDDRGAKKDSTGHVTCMSMDGDLLLVGTAEHVVHVWRLPQFLSEASDTTVMTLFGHTAPVTALASNPSRVFSGSSDGSIRVWSTKDGKCLDVITPWSPHDDQHPAVLCLFARSAVEDPRLYCGYDDGTVLFYHQSSIEDKPRSLPSHAAAVTHVIGDPVEGVVVTSSLDGSVHFASTDSRELLQLLQHEAGVKHFERSSDILLTACEDGAVYCWNTSTGHRLHRFLGHEGSPRRIQLLNRILFTSGSDGTVQAWDVVSGKCLAVLEVCIFGEPTGLLLDERCHGEGDFPETHVLVAVGNTVYSFRANLTC